MIARVVVDIKASMANEYFDYLIPKELEPFCFIGSRVIIPFALRDVTGYVMELLDKSEFEGNLKAIKEVLAYEKELEMDQIVLAKHLCQEFPIRLIDALDLMIPSFLKEQQKRYLHIQNYQSLHPTLALLFNGKKKIQQDDTLKSHLSLIQKEIKKGNIEIGYEFVSYGERLKTRFYVLKEPLSVKSERRNEVIRYLTNKGKTAEDEIIRHTAANFALLRKMAKDKQIQAMDEFVFPEEKPIQIAEQTDFTYDQKQIIDQFEESKQKPSLLYCNDESFLIKFVLRQIKRMVANRQLTVVVVPNIIIAEEWATVLRKQTEGLTIHTYHSKNSKQDNYRTYINVKHGLTHVLITTPMGVFLPFQQLGLAFVLDEEQLDYISEQFPYQDARSIIEWRSSQQQAACLYVSQVPSIIRFYQARNNQIQLLDASVKKIQKFSIIDLREEILENEEAMLTKPVKLAIQQAMQEHKTSLLIVNNKAYSTMISCRECGKVYRCPKCHIPLSEVKGKIKCNYCGYQMPVHESCSCGANEKKHLGFGLEQVFQKLSFIFPQAKIVQFDAQAVQSIEDYQEWITQLEEGQIDILLGTNVLTKIMQYDTIKVVGFLAIDQYLNSADHRGAEKTYQLIAKMDAYPEVYIQTFYPAHYAIIKAMQHDYYAFYEMEIEQRSLLQYEPFSEMNRLIVSGPYEKLFHFAYYYRKALSHIPNVTVLGPLYDYKAKGVKCIIKHNNLPLVIKILQDAMKNFQDDLLQIRFERYPKGM
ncbi:MAG: primosomal protein N' [Bacilli bacterium]|jgi:primosomal protein N' (replication factor Y)|nr:primosomal protein N' [Bacilli bacterium]